MEWWGNSALLVSGYDSDAQAYITAVEAADGQALEVAVRDAINAFVVGCKADGIWAAIKACCILAGARTLAGALVPLVGPAPTNFNFVNLDYNRKTGLIGDAATKYLRANRDNTDDPINRHIAAYQTTPATNDTYVLIGTANVIGRTSIIRIANLSARITASSGSFPEVSQSGSAGFVGGVRTSSESITLRNGGANITASVPSQTPASAPIGVFANGAGATPCNPRLSFYSIGESLNLALLDARITGLMNALAAAIP
jgi:hypothetical protein